jgi:uncharacterized protein involved in exopolysaccharide biosynthesis
VSRGVINVDQVKSSGMAQGSSDDEEEEGLDWEKISGYGRFVSGAIRRRWWLSGGTLMTVLGLTYLVYWAMPRSYHIETQLLAQKNNMGIVAGRGQDGVSPTRAAAETVLRRDNLVALLEKSELLKYWEDGISNASRMRNWLNRKLHRPPMSESDKIDMLVGTLESNLTVETKSDWGGEGTVNIALEWSDPKMGVRLVNAAQQSFIEARHLTEISAISEAISILLGRAASMRDEIDATVRKIESKTKEKGERRRQAVAGLGERERRPATPSNAAATAAITVPSERESNQQLLALWESKKAAIKDLEEMRRRRIAELQTRLAELRATYAESHPTIVDTTQTIETLSQESPQLAQLKKEEAALHNQYLGRAAKVPEGTMGEPLSRPIPRGSVRANTEPATGDDRETEFAKAQLRITAEGYDHLLERIEGAHMELEAARAAFKYRYIVVKPAQRPREPTKPKPAKVLGGGTAAALLLSILVAVGADLRSGKVYERWQLERALRLPVLAEIRRDS